MSRASRIFASASQRDRVHEVVIYTPERRTLAANFRAMIPAGVTITRAQWDMDLPGYVTMQTGTVVGPEARVIITAGLECGGTGIRCGVTLSDGSVFSQAFYVRVLASPLYGDGPIAGGPSRIVVVV